jgi:hypothetical protein
MKKLILAITVGIFTVACQAETKSVNGFDCTLKKNEKRIQCVEAPKSDVEKKAKVKKPEKVRKAPASVQKKAEENTKK